MATDRPIFWWGCGWLFLIAAGVCRSLAEAWPQATAPLPLLGPFFPAFLLAGAFVYARRAVPRWLFPLAIVVALTRFAWQQNGSSDLAHAVALVFEPAAGAAAAALCFGVAQRRPKSWARQLLPLGIAILAILEAFGALAGLRGYTLVLGEGIAWMLVVPIVAGLQAADALHSDRFRLRRRERRTQQALTSTEQRFHALIENSFDLVAEVDAQGNVRYLNRRNLEVLGYAPEELVGADSLTIVHPDDQERTARWLQRQIDSGDAGPHLYRARHKDGRWRWIESNARSYRTPEEELRVAVSSRDVTDRIEMAEQVRRAQEDLERRMEERTAELRAKEEQQRQLERHMQQTQRLESLSQLAGGIAHDFNNLLAVILGQSALGLEGLSPDSALHPRLEHIRDAARRCRSLTRQMLTYSGEVAVEAKPLQLSALVEEMAELLAASISKKCRLELVLDHREALVEGDPTQLQQVLLNLVVNGSEALEDRNGRVTVRTGWLTADDALLRGSFGRPAAPPGDYVFLEVADTGRGMDAASLARAFEPFYTTKFAGRGLGLASVLGIVRAHRGVITIDSDPGHGSVVKVLFPPAARHETSAPGARPATRRSGASILVVDDELPVLELTREYLERAGYEVACAAGGREALRLLQERGATLDAVILDLAMPDLSGEETLREIRRLQPTVPILIATGFAEDSALRRFGPGDVAGFLQKPFEAEDLEDALRTCLAD